MGAARACTGKRARSHSGMIDVSHQPIGELDSVKTRCRRGEKQRKGVERTDYRRGDRLEKRKESSSKELSSHSLDIFFLPTSNPSFAIRADLLIRLMHSHKICSVTHALKHYRKLLLTPPSPTIQAIATCNAYTEYKDLPHLEKRPYFPMEPVSSPADVPAQMAQLSLQTNGSTSNVTAAATNPVPAAIVTPITPVTAVNNNSSSTPRTRTGIPRYAIPYRRPDNKPTVDGGIQSPISPPVSEKASSCQQAMPRGRNGFRTESLGDDSLSSGFGRGTSQRYGRAASVEIFQIAGIGYFQIARLRDSFLGLSDHVGGAQLHWPQVRHSIHVLVGSGRKTHLMLKAAMQSSYPLRGDSESEHSSVRILDTKVDFSHAQSKCNSKANLNYKPGGGDIQIVEKKLNFKENSKPRVNSLANARHTPGGGNVKIESRKLKFKEAATSRVGSLQNASHKAGGGNVEIFNEKLPWLKYNKPNLPPEEKAKINKHTPLASDSPNEPIYTSRHPSTAS
ncbi:Microtubule-associated protein [Echinococcus granulosus]|uniref:Microtubule-associated protein n=1 Tax=Echinococcus granulosus TaxID=6210 RepID=W6V1B5_ECHGR|nr:Microtubule-associated protein [Echinococcus granulosus]EUB64712.1 Microtubule-associated protein [Echinococcus granulosus]